MKQLKINNSKKAAIKLGKKLTWKNPGAELYDELLDAFYCEGGVPDGGKEFEDAVKSGRYVQWDAFLKEAYMVAPVDQIKNSPYGKTPFSRSGCKYPHHVIRNGELVVSIPGLRAAYICARNQGVFVNHTSENKKIVAHFNRHFKELGIEPLWHHGELYFKEEAESWKKIEENFDSINQFILENMEINLFDPIELQLFDEASYVKESADELSPPVDVVDTINEAMDWIDRFVNDNEFRESITMDGYGYDEFTENWVISQKNFEINLDQWKPGNPLWITGASGDGKSTLTEKMAKEYNAKIVSSDVVLSRMIYSKERFEEMMNGTHKNADIHKMDFSSDSPALDYVLSHPELPYGAKDPENGINGDITSPEMIKFFNWCMVELSNNPKYNKNLYVIEGCDICLLDPEVMAKKPVIVIGVSRLVSMWRRAKRFSEKKNSSMLTALFHYIKKYNIKNKRLDDAKDAFRKALEKASTKPINESEFTESIISPDFLELVAEDIDADDESEILRVNELLAKGYTPTEIEALKFIRESDEGINDNEDKKTKSNEEFVPIYGIVKCYSTSKLRNDGTEKSQSELNSIRFHKIIERLTRGDKYSHALVSFDDSLTKMYSYEDEGFEIDNILTKDSWMGTESIYICVMFVSKSDKARMQKFIKDLAINANRSRYASANLLKAYVATPYKVDKRFVCSSFTGYIMSCANPKNLHRDYSRCRPEDITILPRAFYLMNVRDRDDFMEHRDEIKDKVNKIYEEFHEEIEDYNNHLPKLMIKDRVDKLKTIDKIFDWIIDRM